MRSVTPNVPDHVWVVGDEGILNEVCQQDGGSGEYTLVPVPRHQFAPGQVATAGTHALVYHTTTSVSDTLVLLDQLTTFRNDLCVIVVGENLPADAVAQLLRRGAFDYVTWPAASGRLAESITSGLANRRTFLEVQNLSDELASANTALAKDRDMLKLYSQRMAGLNHLTQALAGSLKADGVVKALFAGLPGFIGADLISVVRRHPDQVWTWSRSASPEEEARVRTQLLGRLEHTATRTTSRATTLRLVHSRPASMGHARRPMGGDRIHQTGGVLDIPLVLGAHSTGVLHVERGEAGGFSEEEIQVLATVGASLSLSLRNADTYQQIQDLALRDPLTGLLNRRALDGPMMREFKAGLRYGTSACVMLLDIDYFKTVNDRLGHSAGDQVLKGLAELMTDTVRDIDLVGRHGGEEFAVILPHTTLEQAMSLGERLRRLIEDHGFAITGGMVRLTASIGIAPLHDPAVSSVDDWINAADEALYEAKAQGRNRVVAHGPKASAPMGVVALCAAA